jgi:beta-glucosidase
MKNLYLFLALMLCASSIFNVQCVDIEDLLSRMTLREKIGQMTQIAAIVMYPDGTTVDPGMVRQAIETYGVGSIYNHYYFVSSRGTGQSAWTIDEWRTFTDMLQDVANSTVNKIPLIYGVDAINGASFVKNATIFPHNFGLAATWNVDLARQAAFVTAKDCRTVGINWSFAPTADVAVQPNWGRFYETFGDDPVLISEMVRASIRGAQQSDNTNELFCRPEGSSNYLMAACGKHFVGYSQPDGGYDRRNATIADWMLERYHYPPFQVAVAENVSTMMLNSVEFNGMPVHIDKTLVTDLLKNSWNFNGFVVSDYQSLLQLTLKYNIPTYREAIRLAILAGLDMYMVPLDFSFVDILHELVMNNEVPEELITNSARRILNVKQKLGLFENPYTFPNNVPTIGSDEDLQVAMDIARESITLLKNENNVLPLAGVSKVLVTGPASNSLMWKSGAWVFHWQGAENDDEFNGRGKTILSALQDTYGADNVVWGQGAFYDAPADAQNMLEQAAQADVVVVAIGEPPGAEMKNDIDDLNLPEEQINLVNDLAAVAKKIVVIVVAGRPRLFPSIIDNVDAILFAYLPGPYGGAVINEILTGVTNPSGRLSFAYPTANAQLSYQYGQYKHEVQWARGHGLSYTTFSYSNLQLSSSHIYNNEQIRIAIDITNDGTVDGKEVVRLNIADLFNFPDEEYLFMLKKFTKISLKAGETKTAEFLLGSSDLIRVDTPYRMKQGVTVKFNINEQIDGEFTFIDQQTTDPTPLPDISTPSTTHAPSPTSSPSVVQTPIDDQIRNNVNSASNLVAELLFSFILLGTVLLI